MGGEIILAKDSVKDEFGFVFWRYCKELLKKIEGELLFFTLKFEPTLFFLARATNIQLDQEGKVYLINS